MDKTEKNIVIKRKKCPKGTRKNRQGICEPIQVVESEPNAQEIEPLLQAVPKTTEDINRDEHNAKNFDTEQIKATNEQIKQTQSEILAAKKDEPLVIEKGDMEVEPVKTIIVRKTVKPLLVNDILASVSKNTNEFLRKKEQIEHTQEKDSNDDYSFLYPSLNDPDFSKKIAEHQEFYDTQYDGTIRDVKEYAEKLCNEPFELMPHQLFVKNFLSFQTPYNSLLLYHGLGSGKTCSSIGIAEEMRQYMKQVGIKQRIIVVAAPNVQANYKLQLFDERNLKEEDGIWNIKSCVGNVFLREINPTSIQGMSRDRVIYQVKSIINQYYVFMGYVELANFIRKKTMVQTTGFNDEEVKKMEIQNMRKFFNNRLIIIDEVHNIRLADDNVDDKTGKLLMKLVRFCNNMRLLLLSATPLYNSHTEIIWLTNLMNLNDKRGLINVNEVFDKNGLFKDEKKDQSGTIIEEGGYELLTRKLTGYISYIRGENPYIFPYRIYPDTFAVEKTFAIKNETGILSTVRNIGETLTGTVTKQIELPTKQLNGKEIENPLRYLPIYLNEIGEYQSKAYNLLIKSIKKNIKTDAKINFDELDKFGFRILQYPLEALNMVYPNTLLDDELKKQGSHEEEKQEGEKEIIIDALPEMVGKRGLNTVMNYVDDSKTKVPRKYKYSYKENVVEKYGRIFNEKIIGNYSSKISSIIQTIKKSKGIILIYSQYIDGGIVPMSLALEEIGFTRYGSSDHTTSLFETPPTEPIDSLTMKPKSEVKEKFKPAQYVMITGDKSFSPNNLEDIKTITNDNNKNGEMVKVVLISKAGSEGLDFKCIRQIHILEPWYNLNRIEQISGRGVRQKSHCLLPFEERNVEIYMHGTVLKNRKEEAVDIYIYRLARNKAEKIGRVTRLLKETSVDCLLNIGQNNFTLEKMNSIVANKNLKINIASNKTIEFKIGDKPFTDICDYMADCAYKCNKKYDTLKVDKPNQELYSESYLQSNNQHIMKRIRDLYREINDGKHFFNLTEIIESINITKQYPISQIYSALSVFINNKNEYIIDKYGRRGNLINKGDIYAFQPIEISDENITVFERKVPIDFKRNNVTLEIPKSFPETDLIKTSEIEYDTIIREINKNVDISREEHTITQGDQNWYKHASLVSNHLQLIHGINFETYIDYVIHHCIDTLMPDEKLKVISYIYSHIRSETDLTETEKAIKSYLDKEIVTYKNKSGIILTNLKGWELYIQSSEDPSKWELAEPEDIRNFEISQTLSDTFTKDVAFYSNVIGFIDMFRNSKEMVFRIKDLSQMQNNTGTRINGQTPGKGDIIKRLNSIVYDGEIMEDHMYSLKKSKEIMQQGLCVIVEMLLRNRTEGKYKNKIWFLNPQQAMYNKISKFRR